MDALALILLGRRLMKLGEDALRGPRGTALPAGPALVLRDVFANPDSSIAQITARTGLPQSYVSESVARLRDQGLVETAADPSDGRRTLVRVSAAHPRRVVREGALPVDGILTKALGGAEAKSVRKIIRSLEAAAERLGRTGGEPGPLRRSLDRAREQMTTAARGASDQAAGPGSAGASVRAAGARQRGHGRARPSAEGTCTLD